MTYSLCVLPQVINLCEMSIKTMKILIFTEGTLIMHSRAKGYSREDIVRQVENGVDSAIYNWIAHIPIGNSVKKLQKWNSQGARINYLTSRTKPSEVEDIKNVLKKHGFPQGKLLFRQKNEEYRDVVEKAVPDVLIEDDCESIGGIEEMAISNVRSDLKQIIKSIVVKEFEGIDHLPDDLNNLGCSNPKNQNK